jgi:hypothetical protein
MSGIIEFVCILLSAFSIYAGDDTSVHDSIDRNCLKKFFELKQQKKIISLNLADMLIHINKTSQICVFEQKNGKKLSGAYDVSLGNGIMLAIELVDGTLDGFVIVYTLIPHYNFLAIAKYKDGYPCNGYVMFDFVNKTLLVWRLFYNNGVFVKYSGLNSTLSPFVNEIKNGKVVGGYEIKKIDSSTMIEFYKIKDGKYNGITTSNDFIKLGFDPKLAQELLQSIIDHSRKFQVQK